MSNQIKINCDVGEQYGNLLSGKDDLIFPYIDQCNIACGFHAGDPFTIEKTIKLAIKHNVSIGAHPSYPDLMGFGRNKMDIDAERLKSIIKYQISALKGMTESMGERLIHVKAHGALYHQIIECEQTALIFVEAVQEIDNQLQIMCMPDTIVQEICQLKSIEFIKEAFIDRNYNESGKLISRKEKNAVISEPEVALEQLLAFHVQNKLMLGNIALDFNVDSYCIHGDNPAAVAILEKIKSHFI